MSDMPDRRSQKSTRALWQGLLALLQNHDWADITVQMIADRADVARSTFYAHYQTKQDLLEAGFALAGADIREEILSRPPRAGRIATVDWLIDHISVSRGFLRRVTGTPAGMIILNRFQQTTAKLLAEELARCGKAPSSMTLAFLMGGTFAVIEQWLAGTDTTDSDVLGALLASQILAATPA